MTLLKLQLCLGSDYAAQLLVEGLKAEKPLTDSDYLIQNISGSCFLEFPLPGAFLFLVAPCVVEKRGLWASGLGLEDLEVTSGFLLLLPA